MTALVNVHNLSAYDAATLEEAASNQTKWMNDGSAGIDDVLSTADSVTFTVEPVQGNKE